MKKTIKKLLNYVKHNKLVCTLLFLSLFINGGSSDNSADKELINDLTEQVQNLEEHNKELEEKVAQAEPWFELKEEERKAEEEKLAKEKAEKEKAEREEAERKEKLGYDTGITYSQLARTPDEYEGEKCKFRGKVVQVMEGDGIYNIRLAVDGDYDNIIFILAETDVLDQRILEDDYITVYGTSTGIYTYESTLGASISIPSMLVDKVEL